MGECGQCSRFFWVHVYFDGRYRPSTDSFGMRAHRRSILTDFFGYEFISTVDFDWVKSTVDQISTVFSSRWILIDRRYRPFSQVGESLSTVDIDRDRSTGRLKNNRPIDDTCADFGRFCPVATRCQGKPKKFPCPRTRDVFPWLLATRGLFPL